MRARALVLTLVLLPSALRSQVGTVSFQDAAWSVEPATAARVATHLGRPALVLGSGRALRRDIRFTDGTIEFDLAVTGGRVFAYIQFRMVDDDNHEEVYFRSHKSGLPDAVQYTPVHQGLSGWQLYHGPGGTAAVEFPRDGWVRIRLVIQGRALAVFVGEAPAPQLVVPRMARPSVEGYIALRTFVPAGVDPVRHAAGFSNLVIRPGVVPFGFSGTTAAAPAAPGTVMRWAVSQAFAPDTMPITRLPDSLLNSASWKTVAADPRGMLTLAEHLAIPPAFRRWSALARLRLRADAPRTIRLLMGFSDQVTVFLNGRPIMSADQRYSFDNPRQEGVIGFHQGTVYLPLTAGENQLILAVTDQFGGWAVMGRLEDAEGVRVLPE